MQVYLARFNVLWDAEINSARSVSCLRPKQIFLLWDSGSHSIDSISKVAKSSNPAKSGLKIVLPKRSNGKTESKEI
jgi:hypothetical protein